MTKTNNEFDHESVSCKLSNTVLGDAIWDPSKWERLDKHKSACTPLKTSTTPQAAKKELDASSFEHERQVK